MESIGEQIECSGGVKVHEGDVIVADINGVVVIPKGELDLVLQTTRKLVEADNRCMEDLKSGSSLEETFKKHRS